MGASVDKSVGSASDIDDEHAEPVDGQTDHFTTPDIIQCRDLQKCHDLSLSYVKPFERRETCFGNCKCRVNNLPLTDQLDVSPGHDTDTPCFLEFPCERCDGFIFVGNDQ